MEKNQQNQELVLWKGKQNWHISGQAHQEEKWTEVHKIKNEKRIISPDTRETQKL